MTSERVVKKQSFQHLLQASALEDSGSSALVLNTIIATGIVVWLLVLWAMIAPMQEVAHAPGVIIPKGDIAKIQPLKEGLVSSVLVKNGDRVKQGALLLSLDPASTKAELQTLRAREMAIAINDTRLRFLISGDPLSEMQLVAAGNPKTHEEIKTATTLAQDALRLYNEQKNAHESQLEVLHTHISRLEKEAEIADMGIQTLKLQIELSKESLGVVKKQHLSRLSLLHAKEKYQSLLSNLAQFTGKKEQALLLLQEARAMLSETTAKFRESQSEKLNSNTVALLAAEASVQKCRDALAHLFLTSPVNGMVNHLTSVPGETVALGQVVAEVIPMDDAFLIEARVNPKDIEAVKLDNGVRIKVAEFNLSHFGPLQGRVKSVSSHTFLDENQHPYYKALIQLKNEQHEAPILEKQLMPGMQVNADIITGERTLLTYLLKPMMHF